MSKNIIILSGDELRRLAKLVYYQEVQCVQRMDLESEAERRKLLKQSKASYHLAMGLLDSGEKLRKEYEDDSTKYPIAHQIFICMEWTVNTSFQFVLGHTLRLNSLNQVSKYCDTLVRKLRALDPNDPSGIIKLLSDLRQYERAMEDFASPSSHPVVSGASNLYKKLNTWIVNEQITFDSLLIRFKRKLGFEKPFKELSESEKAQVYENILVASGRDIGEAEVSAKFLGGAGVVCMLVTANTMVWDNATSDQKLQTAIQDTVVLAALMAGVCLGRAAATALLDAVAADVAVLGIALGPVGALIGSIVVATILSGLAGWATDKLFSLGKHHESQEPPTAKLIPQHNVVLRMPDARAMAYQIVYQRQRSS